MRPYSHFLSLSLLVAVACYHAPGSRSASAATAAPRVTEANIVAIILAANATDLSYARLVPARARSTEVKGFAQRMTTVRS
ncbi:MAG: hypothetical protein ABI625_27380, partial [bacterium]